MALRKRNGIYHIDLQIRGERVRQTTGTSNRELAKQIHDELAASLWKKNVLRKVLWKQAVVSYFQDRQQTGSWRDDVRRVSVLDQWLGSLMLDEIDQGVIRNVKTGLSLRDLKPSTINRYLNTMGAILNYSVEQEWLEKAPTIRRLTERPTRLEYLTPEEVNKLMEAFTEQVHKDFTILAVSTGLRKRNLTHLEWKDVDLFRRTITIHADQHKNGKVHVAPINNMAFKVLKRLHRPSGRVLQYRGRDVDDIGKRAFRNAQKRAGIEKHVHPHLFRHTFASWHVMMGTPLVELKELGGWSKLESVMRYAHLNLDHLKASSAKIQEALSV